MNHRGSSTGRLALALLAAGVVVFGQPALAAADSSGRTYDDPPFSTAYVHPAKPDPQHKLFPQPPTRDTGQSKLWYHADAWWALMLEPTGHASRVFELMPDHTWRATSALVNSNTGSVGDALPDGDAVHVVTRSTDGSLLYVRLSYDAAKRDYHAAPARLVTTRDSLAPAMVAKDTAGALWVGYVTNQNVVVIGSTDGGLTWGSVLTLASRPANGIPQSGALIAYDDRVGILWSDQAAHTFDFAWHHAGDNQTFWTLEKIPVPPAQENDVHVSLVAVPGAPLHMLAAAVTTAARLPKQPHDLPPVQLLVRTPEGKWSAHPLSSQADPLDDVVLQVDVATQTLRLFAVRNGNIVTDQASLTDLNFASGGVGSLFMNGVGGSLTLPTVARSPVDSRTGLVVLASDLIANRYRHAELPISSTVPVADPSDHTPPTTPAGLLGHAVSSGKVVLSWAESTDGARWAPARRGVPVSGYVVKRSDVTIAKVSTPSVQDRVTSGTAGRSITYTVQAVDASGNLSPPAQVSVFVPPTVPPPPLYISVGLIALAALAAAYALYRRWAARRLAMRDVLPVPDTGDQPAPVRELTPDAAGRS